MTKLQRLVLTAVPEPMKYFKLNIPMIAAGLFFFLAVLFTILQKRMFLLLSR